MDEYVVTKQIGSFKPDVAECFADEKDAKTYAEIMNRRPSDWHYKVYKAL